MNKARLRTSYVPVKHAETSRISSLSRGLVPFMVSQGQPVGYVVTNQIFFEVESLPFFGS